MEHASLFGFGFGFGMGVVPAPAISWMVSRCRESFFFFMIQILSCSGADGDWARVARTIAARRGTVDEGEVGADRKRHGDRNRAAGRDLRIRWWRIRISGAGIGAIEAG